MCERLQESGRHAAPGLGQSMIERAPCLEHSDFASSRMSHCTRSGCRGVCARARAHVLAGGREIGGGLGGLDGLRDLRSGRPKSAFAPHDKRARAGKRTISCSLPSSASVTMLLSTIT